MDKSYDPHAIEQRWYQTWESEGWFAPPHEGSADDTSMAVDITDTRHPYCIMIPPPNVTGSLHMGHAFQDLIMDALTRFHRMKGHQTLWQPGSDHAGIATQMVVERLLQREDKTRHDLGREGFLQRVWEWKEESGGHITRQLRRMGASLDWENERFTMDAGLSDAVNEVFVKLYEEDLIYRGKRLVNWDPVLHTAVSDLEVISEEENGHMWDMRYPLSDGSGYLIVATTRPETMLGDAAVAVHPDDERYTHLVGKTVILPLADREIPIIADEYVDPEFGTGCVKITPAHDFNDYEVGQRHDLQKISIFTFDAKINDNAPEAWQGMDRFEARKAILAELEAQGLLADTRDHKLMVPRGDRSGSVIEPMLTDQWYVKAAPLAEPAVKAVEDGRIKFVPENWSKTYYNWMNDIQDWCISRQIWWGHRIPAWYDNDGKVYVGRNEDEVRTKHQLGDIELRQDEDVLDTWFSSALWPFSTLGWPQDTQRLQRFYPTSVLVTGFDIIFFWVARMIMMGLKFMDDVPFREVYIHGLVRDSHGHKMSKSKGNVLDPIDLIDGISLDDLLEKRTSGMMQPHLAKKIAKQTREDFPEGIPSYGTDALRFTFAALASTGRDINFDMGRIEGYRNFCNKLWNAARYVLMNAEEQDCGSDGDDNAKENEVQLSVADRWIRSRLQHTIEQVTGSIEKYRFDHAAKAIYEFTWNEYCDWYLELSKTILNDDEASEAAKRGTRQTLVQVLESVLRLTHPIMPFITEEIWQRVAPLAGINANRDDLTIMLQPWPLAEEDAKDSDAETELDWIMQFILGVRRIKGEMNIAPGKRVPVLLAHTSDSDRQRLQTARPYLDFLARTESVEILGDEDEGPESAIALVGSMKVLIPLAGLIDKAAELARLDKETGRLQAEVERIGKKLGNANFVDRAPEAVVQKERDKLAEAEQALADLQEQSRRIAAL